MTDTGTEYRDWNVVLTFNVPTGDTEGVMTDAIFDAAVEHAPSDATGLVASADTAKGKVWIVYTLANASGGFARDSASAMRSRIAETVFSGDEACVTATP
jgi:hypothetical protein